MQFYDGLRWVPWYIEALVHPWFRWLIKQRIAVEAAFRASMASCSCYCSRPVSDWLVGRLPPLFLGDGAKPLAFISGIQKNMITCIVRIHGSNIWCNALLSDIPSFMHRPIHQQPPAANQDSQHLGKPPLVPMVAWHFHIHCFRLSRPVLSQEYCYMICSVIEGSLNRNFRQYGQLKSRVE